jgi:heterocyst specific transport system permease protein
VAVVFTDIPLAWLQLTRERSRLLAAVAGVAFAVLLVFMQFGFSNALYASAVRFHGGLVGEIFLVNPKSAYLVHTIPFSRRRLYQALGFAQVESVGAIYATLAMWKNPFDGSTRNIFVLGVDPTQNIIDLPGVQTNLGLIRYPDVVLFDEGSRPEYGPVVKEFKSSALVSIDLERGSILVRRGKALPVEVSDRRVTVAGLFRLGTSFGIDGTLLTSDLNFLRLLPGRAKGLIDIGVIKLRPGVDADAMARALATYLPNDVLVLTKKEFMQREKDFWATTTPIGFVFTFGAIIGLVVGLVIVYQILFADISDHLAEYATLKAIGYTDRYLFSVVFQEATILAVLGYIPGWLVSLGLYRLAENATLLPMRMGLSLQLSVLALTIGMCCASGAIALRKVRSADPADVF